MLTIDTTPKPLVLAVHGDGTITGPPGPVTINGVIAAGYVSGAAGTGATQKDQYGNLYDSARAIAWPATPTTGYYPVRAPTRHVPRHQPLFKGSRRRRADHGNRSAQVHVQWRRQGSAHSRRHSHARHLRRASTGFSVQFFPESVILGCGPDAARAYPYTVSWDGGSAVVKIAAPDHPLSLAFRPDGSLDPGSPGLTRCMAASSPARTTTTTSLSLPWS